MSIFQITSDKSKYDGQSWQYGDIVIWTEEADLAQDENGIWYDQKCIDRGTVICTAAADVLIGRVPRWNGEIVKIKVTVNEFGNIGK